MRATSIVVALSSSFALLAGSASAGPAPTASKEKTEKAPAKPAAKAPAGKTAPTAAPDAAAAGAGANAGASAPTHGGGAAQAPAPEPDLAAVAPEDMPTAVRMRRLEQRTQALKERAWQLKARVQMLKEQMIGGGAGAQTVIAHANEMGASFRLTKLIYALDGTQVFARTDDTGESLYKTGSFDVFAGPISPGNHTVSAVATYRGHGYGVFEYLSKYTFTAKGNQAFIAGEGKISKVDCHGFEKGGPTTPLEKRAAVECKVTQLSPEKPADKEARPADSAKPAAPPGAAVPAAPPAAAPPAAPPSATAPGQPGK